MLLLTDETSWRIGDGSQSEIRPCASMRLENEIFAAVLAIAKSTEPNFPSKSGHPGESRTLCFLDNGISRIDASTMKVRSGVNVRILPNSYEAWRA